MCLNNDLIGNWLKISLGKLLDKDGTLIDRNLKEECINHRLANYLEEFKPAIYLNSNVDLEYNKNGDDAKRGIIFGINVPIRPDIIVHRRTLNTHNTIALECKKNFLTVLDKIKLQNYLDAPYSYQIALGISYNPNKIYILIYCQEEANAAFQPHRYNKQELIQYFRNNQ